MRGQILHASASCVTGDPMVPDCSTRRLTLSLLKEPFRGEAPHQAPSSAPHHQFEREAFSAYLDEVAFKYNNRQNETIFRDTLRVLVTADPLTHSDLIAE